MIKRDRGSEGFNEASVDSENDRPGFLIHAHKGMLSRDAASISASILVKRWALWCGDR